LRGCFGHLIRFDLELLLYVFRLPEIASNVAQGNRLTNSAQEVMVSCVLLQLPYIFVAVPLLHQIRKCSENYKRAIYSMVHVKLFLKEKTSFDMGDFRNSS